MSLLTEIDDEQAVALVKDWYLCHRSGELLRSRSIRLGYKSFTTIEDALAFFDFDLNDEYQNVYILIMNFPYDEGWAALDDNNILVLKATLGNTAVILRRGTVLEEPVPESPSLIMLD